MPSDSYPDQRPNTTEYPSADELLRRATIPYKRKGFGAVVAVLILIGFFYFAPIVFAKLWPYVLENIPERHLMFVIGVPLHTGLALITNLSMYVIYKIKLPFFERYRVSDKPWPWESKPEEWKQLFKKTMKVLAFSHLVMVPALMVIDGMNGIVMRMDVESLPSLKEMISQMIFFMILEDFMFYWCHRTLHHPKLYPYIHKLHHEYNITISITGEYAHPIEALFGNVIPMNAGPKLLGSKVHILTYLMWAIFRLVESVDGHCGYEFSWSPYGLIPLSPISSYHNFHHSHNVGNYSSLFTFWDTLCGTNKHYYEYQAKREKAKRLAAAKNSKGVEKNGKEHNEEEQKNKLMKNLGSTPENRVKTD